MKLGILGAASIVVDRFLPSLMKIEDVECVGIAARDKNSEKLQKISSEYGIKIYDSYDDIINDNNIDSVYIPLPPALHFQWAKKCLLNGKNVFLEKPSTINFKEIEDLVNLARKKNLAIYENYMFLKHKQLAEVKEYIDSGILGDVRLYRSCFSFPKREKNDFRYNKELGGGALLDAGGYVIKLATYLLGDSMEIVTGCVNTPNGENVDFYGSFTAKNGNGEIFQGAFGMDNNYECSLEVYGQKAKLVNSRIFTAGSDFQTRIEIFSNEPKKEIMLSKDDHFMNSINYFNDLVKNKENREKEYSSLLKQTKNLEKLKGLSNDLF